LGALRSNTPSARALAERAVLAARQSGRLGKMTTIKMLARLGKIDRAFKQATVAFAKLDGVDPGLLFRQTTAQMRKDPRFMAIAAMQGLVDFWTVSGKWPDFCSQPGLPYDCRVEGAKVMAHRHI
jgi:hypothetical protein